MLSLSIASFSDTCKISTTAHLTFSTEQSVSPLAFYIRGNPLCFSLSFQTSPSVSGSSHSGTSSQTNLLSFAPNLAQIWVTNFQLLVSFIPDLDNPTLIVVSKQALHTETLASF